MLPVVAGARETRRQILLYTLLLAPLGVAPWLLGYAGLSYGIVALATGAIMIALALRVRGEEDRAQPQASSCSASRSFISSCCSPCCCSTARPRGCPATVQHDADARNDERRHERAEAAAWHQADRAAVACAPRRSIAIAVSLGVLVVLFYVMTLVKGPGVLVRPL